MSDPERYGLVLLVGLMVRGAWTTWQATAFDPASATLRGEEA